MIVCICNQVTERDIQHAAADGCSSLRELKKTTGLGSQCGTCCQDGKEVLKCCMADMKALDCAEPVL